MLHDQSGGAMNHIDGTSQDCLRKQRSLVNDSGRTRSGYKTFIKCLNLSADGKLAPLPNLLSELQSRFMPDALNEVVSELTSKWEDAHIVCSFYQALLDHDGANLMNDGLNSKSKQIVRQNAAPTQIVAQFIAVLNGLYREKSAN